MAKRPTYEEILALIKVVDPWYVKATGASGQVTPKAPEKY